MGTTKSRITHKKPQLNFWTALCDCLRSLHTTTIQQHHRITALQYMRKSRQISLGRNTPSGPKSQTQQEQQPNKSI